MLKRVLSSFVMASLVWVPTVVFATGGDPIGRRGAHERLEKEHASVALLKKAAAANLTEAEFFHHLGSSLKRLAREMDRKFHQRLPQSSAVDEILTRMRAHSNDEGALEKIEELESAEILDPRETLRALYSKEFRAKVMQTMRTELARAGSVKALFQSQIERLKSRKDLFDDVLRDMFPITTFLVLLAIDLFDIPVLGWITFIPLVALAAAGSFFDGLYIWVRLVFFL